MSEEVRVWQVEKDEKLTEINRCKLDLEQRIEKWILSDISVLSSDYLIIGEQVATAYGKYIDLLCIDSTGKIIIVELKRDKTPREVTAQALDYASWVKDLIKSDIESLAEKHFKGKTLETEFYSKFKTELPEEINKKHGMLVVASEIDDSTERIVRYLSESHGVDINVVRFQFFQSQDGRELLLRTFTVAPVEAEKNTSKNREGKRILPTSEEMELEAEQAGVGDLYRKCKSFWSPHFRVGNTKTTCSFQARMPDGSLKVVFSLVPNKSSAEIGLRYQLYSKRLAEYKGISEDTILTHLPKSPERYGFSPDSPPDLQGWAGFIKNELEIQRIAQMLENKSV